METAWTRPTALMAVAAAMWCVQAYADESTLERVRQLGFKRMGAPRPGDWLASFREPGQTFKQYVASDPVRAEQGRSTIYLQPFGDMVEFLMFHRSREVFDVETRPVLNQMVRGVMEYARERLVASVSTVHPWVRWDGPAEVDRACKELLEGAPFCEAMGTIGGSLLAWNTRPICVSTVLTATFIAEGFSMWPITSVLAKLMVMRR